MQSKIITFSLLSLLVVGTLAAQPSDESVLTYEVIQSERKSLAMETLDLTKEQYADLSPIYDDYLADLSILERHRLHVVQEFMKKYKALSDEEALVLLDEITLIDKLRLKLHENYTAEFGTVLPARLVLRLWQVENKLDAIVNMQFAKEVPLAR